MPYELHYWPSIQGRGEFVRLALEDADIAYVDVARQPGTKGLPAMLRLLDGKDVVQPPFAPPFLRAGKLLIGQTANILLFLGSRHGLAPRTEAGRLWTHQLQLTIADAVNEVHDTHHPIASGLYYEDQRQEARRRQPISLPREPRNISVISSRCSPVTLVATNTWSVRGQPTPTCRCSSLSRVCATPSREPWRDWNSINGW